MEAIVAGPARRERLTAEIMERTGIDEAMIERLVHGFYAKVRADAVLGPVFEARIADWEPHLAQMCAFWSSVALMTGRYHGTPMAKHLPLPVDAGHFDRWLALFEQTAARDLSARSRGAFRGTGAADRGQPRTRHRRHPRRHARQRRTILAQPGRSKVMAHRTHVVTNKEQANPYSGSSLVPMLVIGLLLTFAGMIAALVLS